jgi:peptide/nickel transport system substrate-binding protein
MIRTWVSSVLLVVLLAAASASLVFADPRHGLAMHGEPALPADFRHLPYVNPDAPQGGLLRQAITGSFDSVNPLSSRVRRLPVSLSMFSKA